MKSDKTIENPKELQTFMERDDVYQLWRELDQPTGSYFRFSYRLKKFLELRTAFRKEYGGEK